MTYHLAPEDQLWKFILDNEDQFFTCPHVLATYRNKITGIKTLAFFKLYSLSLMDC